MALDQTETALDFTQPRIGARGREDDVGRVADGVVADPGDDVVDLPVMTRVGLAISVQDGHPLTKQHAHWTTPSNGGRGAAREVCEMIMDAQQTLQSALARYLA